MDSQIARPFPCCYDKFCCSIIRFLSFSIGCLEKSKANFTFHQTPQNIRHPGRRSYYGAPVSGNTHAKMVTHCDNLLHRKQACSQPGHYGRGAGQWGTGRPVRAAAWVTGERTERGQVRRPKSSWHLGSSQCREGTGKEGAHSEDPCAPSRNPGSAESTKLFIVCLFSISQVNHKSIFIRKLKNSGMEGGQPGGGS